MNVETVLDVFRTEVNDISTPYLWADTEVYRYMNDAYVMFCRMTGGVADFTSDVTRVPVVTGEEVGELDKSILRIVRARRESDKAKVVVQNIPDEDFEFPSQTGRVSAMTMGVERGKCVWDKVPAEDDVVLLNVYRLPLREIVDSGDDDFELDDVEPEHHLHLVHWMKHLAYLKNDADTFDKKKSIESREIFEAYCRQVKADWERYKHKTRIVAYGGI